MTIAKMSMNRNSSRYFRISVNGFENGCLSGIIYHEGAAPGIRFRNFLEMMLHMNRIFDELAYPKRTMDYHPSRNMISWKTVLWPHLILM